MRTDAQNKCTFISLVLIEEGKRGKGCESVTIFLSLAQRLV